MNDPQRTPRSDAPSISRRAVLASSVGAGLGVSLASSRGVAAATPAATAAGETALVVVNLRGGNDGLNTVVPTAAYGAYRDRRPTLGVDESELLRLDVGPAATTAAALHPSLPQLHGLWSSGELAIVQKVGYPRPTRSHFSSQDIWAKGYRDDGQAPGGGTSGWLARYKDRYATGAFGVVGVKTTRLLEFQGGTTPSLILDSVADFGFALDPRYEDNARWRNQVVQRVLDRSRVAGQGDEVRRAGKLAHGLIERVQRAGARYAGTVTYPESGLGQSLREAAVVLGSELGTRVAYAQTGSFDTHSRQADQHAALLADVDASLGAFATDLRALGLWNRVVVAVISEFGRTTGENGSGGTDHGSGNAVLLLGGAVQGGLHGRNVRANDLGGPDLTYTIDYRSVFEELVADHLAADPAEVFPAWARPSGPLGLLR